MKFHSLRSLVKSRYRMKKITQLRDKIKDSQNDAIFPSPVQLTVHTINILLKNQEASNRIVDAPTIEAALNLNSIRYRRVNIPAGFALNDFGHLLSYSQGLESYFIYERFLGEVLTTRISSTVDFDELDILSNNIPDQTDHVFYEIYPSLPYTVNSIWSFLEFIFSSFTGDIFSLVFYSSISQLISLLIPILTVYATTTVVNLGSQSFALSFGVLTFFLSSFSVSSLYLQTRVIQKLESESDKRAQTAVWDRLLKLDLSALKQYSDADLLSRASSIAQIRSLLSSENISSGIALFFSLGFLFEMFYFLPHVAIYVLPLVLIYCLFVYTKASAGASLLLASLSQRAEYTEYCVSMLGSFSELKSSGNTRHILKPWGKVLGSISKLTRSYHEKDNALEVLSSSFLTLSFLLSFIVIISSGDLADYSSSYLPLLIGYTSALNLFCTSLSSGTVSIINSFVSVLAHWKRASPIVYAPIESGYAPGRSQIILSGDLSIQNLSFAYKGSTYSVFSDLSFSTPASKLTLLHLNPGQGATTLARLILGLYEPSSGHIFFDDHPLNSIQIASLRSQISLAPQDLYIPFGPLFQLFDGPLTQTDEDLTELVKMFGLYDLVLSSRMGIDTPVTGGGSQFSEEQRQLFSLAFAIASRPKILIIDNSISEIPSEVIQNILSFLNAIGTTVLLICTERHEFPSLDPHYLDMRQ